MFTISKEFHFSASHQLEGLSKDHPCSRLHGHNYTVIIYLRAHTLDEVGMVQDYGELKLIKDWIDTHWDHRHLNGTMLVGNMPANVLRQLNVKPSNFSTELNPTAENMAAFLYLKFKGEFPKLKAVGVKETPKTFAYYEPDIRD